MARKGWEWEDHLVLFLLTKPAEVVQEACQVLEKHGRLVTKLKSELYYINALCQGVHQVLHYANTTVAHAPTTGTALLCVSAICLRMHSELEEEFLITNIHSHTLL